MTHNRTTTLITVSKAVHLMALAYSKRSGFSMRTIVDEALREHVEITGKARLEVIEQTKLRA